MFFWFFTIIGGFIKIYSYSMVPYILAENPLTPRREAFALSRRMMQGNKWRAFALDISFWYWYVLSSLTFGLAGLLYLNPYLTATGAELYMALRKEALEESYPYCHNFRDEYLTATPAGVSQVSLYPQELYFIPTPEVKRTYLTEHSPGYSIRILIIMFFLFSFLGWCWEVGLHFFKDGHFVNRGFFIGPYLPIYGSGCILIIILLRRFYNKPVLTFFLIMVICAVIEYATSFALEAMYNVKWWDYSGYLLNINGRICLEGTVFFGLGGCLAIYVLAPLVRELLDHISIRTQTIICLTLCGVFFCDMCYSFFYPNTGKGITQSQYKAINSENAAVTENFFKYPFKG
ncbi:MAG: DUF975 family protein [Bacillota bacterium]|nr:DUF975 family protein [Bacillota bacterium]